MRALVLKAFGGPENFELTTVPDPQVQPGTVVIKVAATSVNQLDIKIRQGLPIAPEPPVILGSDVAGVVEAVGSGGVGLSEGDAVYGCAGGVKGSAGALAEYMLADARLLARKPAKATMREAAALPLVSITAWDALTVTRLRAEDHALIHGGVGGVGHIAVQLAKIIGAKASTTVISEDAGALAKSLGADDTAVFVSEAVEEYVARLTGGAGFDVVVDTVGGNNLQASFKAARVSGHVVTTNARTTQDLSLMHGKALSLSAVFMMLPLLTGAGRERHGQFLQDLSRWVDAGRVRPIIDPHRFTLASAPDAHRLLESGTGYGKIVVDVAPDLH